MNCNGLGDRNKRNKVLTWLKNKPENIILLQETHSTLELENELKKCGMVKYISVMVLLTQQGS